MSSDVTPLPIETEAPDPAAVLQERLRNGLRNAAMRIAYDGTPFQGWQIQNHAETVQGRLQDALSVAARLPVKVYGSGRTDTGVHALGQVANAWVPEDTDLHKLQGSLNALAGPDIGVLSIGWAPPEFHARHSAVGKCYRYRIHNTSAPPVLDRQHCWWVKRPLDLGAMRAGALRLLGTHDFSSFRAKDCAAITPVREMRDIRILLTEAPEGALHLEYEASGFLQHMVRILTGTLVAVGHGEVTPDGVAQILAAKRRDAAGMTAPGQGLHLLRVDYDWQRFPSLYTVLTPHSAE
ncbi:MAG TPA: tRNA pseudouridine(38-40) synthase TruA [bacterium]